MMWTLSWLPERAYRPLVQWTKKFEEKKQQDDEEIEENRI
jgi:hypothetical protein